MHKRHEQLMDSTNSFTTQASAAIGNGEAWLVEEAGTIRTGRESKRRRGRKIGEKICIPPALRPEVYKGRYLTVHRFNSTG